jgi:hypothetical protein
MLNPKKRKNFDNFYKGKKIKVNKDKVQVLNKSELSDYWYDSEIKCRGCKLKFVFKAEDKVRWYEIEKRPHYISPVRCPKCSKLKRYASEICSKHEGKKIDSLDIKDAKEWIEAIRLLKNLGANYNVAILNALQNLIST